MKLPEYKAHELFRQYGLPCSAGFVAGSVEELESFDKPLDYPLVLKAQVQTGGRGKAGGVQFASNRAELISKGKQILGMKIKGLTVGKVFVTGKVEIKKEMYLSFTLDRKQKKAVLIFCQEGGVDINEIAEKFPDKIIKLTLEPGPAIEDFLIEYVMDMSGLSTEYRDSFRNVVKRLYSVFVEMDCMLAEINPLVINVSGTLVALDGKIDIDDNALFRHDDIRKFREETEDTDLAGEARKFNFLYIPIKNAGNIGIISNGSGMIMSSMDLIAKRGMEVACALDLGGGATADRIKEALRIVASNPLVDTIFINIFGGITRCDEIAQGVENAIGNIGGARLVIRLEGTNKEKGLAILEGVKGNISMATGLRDGVDILARGTKA